MIRASVSPIYSCARRPLLQPEEPPLPCPEMPIYEFFCPDNNKIYSFFARSLAYADARPRCPDDPQFRMERMISTFSVTGRAREDSAPAGPAGDPKLDSAMAEMERVFGSMDSENPDPRRVAWMLRTMTHISGEKMPEQMEEVMRRLEGGEALDKLEEDFGEVADAIGAEPSDEDALIRSGDLQKIKERLRAARQRPVRDPSMYEMSEYAELPAEGPRGEGSRRRKRAR